MMHDGYWECVPEDKPPFIGRTALAVGLFAAAAGVVVVAGALALADWAWRATR